MVISFRRKFVARRIDSYTLATCESGDLMNDTTFTHASDNEFAATTSFAEMSWKDFRAILLLLLLYTIQGVPIGLASSIPMIMKERGASYESLSLFSMVSLPFSLKLLWAPLVDSLFHPSVGRRKSWLIPVQLCCGAVMVIGSGRIEEWLGGPQGGGSSPDALSLTLFFTSLFFLMATQDIAVDGWAITMLSRANVGYASTTNSVGQVCGVFLANQGFIALSDASWCAKVLGTTAPLVDLPGFVYFWAWVIIALTILVIFIPELPPEDEDEEPTAGLLDTYRQVIAVFKLRPVQMMCALLLTARVCSAPNDAVSLFKFQEYGMPKLHIAQISPIFLVLNLILPVLTGRYFAHQPIQLWHMGVGLKIAASVLTWGLFQLSVVEYSDGSPSTFFFLLMVIVMGFNEFASTILIGAQMTFFARVADPTIGGTYMTLLNTVANLGSKWPSVLSLYLLPHLTFSDCVHLSDPSVGSSWSTISSGSCEANKAECEAAGGACRVTLDGYTLMITVALVIGIVWLYAAKPVIAQLASYDGAAWITNRKSK